MHISMVIITLMSLRIVLGWVVERKKSFHIDSFETDGSSQPKSLRYKQTIYLVGLRKLNGIGKVLLPILPI